MDEQKLNRWRALLTAEDPLARAGLAALLNEAERCQTVGRIAPAELTEETIAAFEPDLLLWDLGRDPAEEDVARIGEAAGLGLPAMVLLDDPSLGNLAQKVGAKGVLRRQTNAETLAAGIHAVCLGLVVIDDIFLPEPGLKSQPIPIILLEPLTRRETEALSLLAEGLSNRAIAQQMNISPHTVKFHVNSLMKKLDAQSRTDAVVRATRLGLLLL